LLVDLNQRANDVIFYFFDMKSFLKEGPLAQAKKNTDPFSTAKEDPLRTNFVNKILATSVRVIIENIFRFKLKDSKETRKYYKINGSYDCEEHFLIDSTSNPKRDYYSHVFQEVTMREHSRITPMAASNHQLKITNETNSNLPILPKTIAASMASKFYGPKDNSIRTLCTEWDNYLDEIPDCNECIIFLPFGNKVKNINESRLNEKQELFQLCKKGNFTRQSGAGTTGQNQTKFLTQNFKKLIETNKVSLDTGQAGGENMDFVVGPETFFGLENLDVYEGKGKNLRPNNIDYSVEWRKKPKNSEHDMKKIKKHYLKYLRKNLYKFKTIKSTVREDSAKTNISIMDAPEEVLDARRGGGSLIIETPKYTVPEFDWGGSEQSGELARVSVIYAKSNSRHPDSLETPPIVSTSPNQISIYPSQNSKPGGSIQGSPLKGSQGLAIRNSEGSSPMKPELSEIGELAFYGNFEFQGSYTVETPEEDQCLEPDWNVNKGLLHPGFAGDQSIDGEGSQDFLEDGSTKSKKKSRKGSPGSKGGRDEKSVASTHKCSKRNSINKSKYQIARFKKSAYGNQYYLPTHPLYSHDRIC
jgi:hypothetical protein